MNILNVDVVELLECITEKISLVKSAIQNINYINLIMIFV